MSTDRKRLFRTALLGGAATAATGVGFGAGSVAFAQDQDQDGGAVEQVVVSGSRIPRPDLQGNSPVSVVGAEEIALTGQVQVDKLLNDLPQVVPGLTSNNNNPGGVGNTIDLRGIGINRTLVLVNGRRWVPGGLAGFVDLSTIPSGMIERVEVVTGGASAVYGSDAIAGVVNFILKDDFEGLSATVQYDILAKGDGEKIYVDATMGANFADGRGNVMVNISWFKQNPVLQGDRGFSANVCTTTTSPAFGSTPVPTVPFGPFGASALCGAYSPNGTTSSFIVASGSSRVAQGRIDATSIGNIVFNNNGTTAHRAGGAFSVNNIPPGPFTTGDAYNYAPPNYIQLPVTRTTMNMAGHYDINDDIEFFMEAAFVNTDNATRLAPVPATTGVNLHTSNPFLAGITVVDRNNDNTSTLGDSAALLNVLVNTACLSFSSCVDAMTNPLTGAAALTFIANNNNGNMAFKVRRRMVEVGARDNPQDRDAYHFTVGFRGELANGWSWDTYYQYSKFRWNSSVVNDVHASRFKTALDARFDPTNGTTCGPIPNAQSPFATAASGTCVPLNIFGFAGNAPVPNGSGSITPAMVGFIKLDATQETEFEREMFGMNLAGTIVELPAGPLGFAVGVEARRESGRFSPDDSFAQGQTLGFNATQSTRGRVNVWEVYGEFLVPLIADKPFFEYLAVEGGARWSKYSTVGTIFTWKLGGEWRPFEDLKIRGLFQRAVRAPNVSELFAGVAQGFPSYADPCNGFTNTASFGTANYYACLAWGLTTLQATGTFSQSDGQVQAAFSSNPNLTEETSNTWTVGGVFTPHQIPNLELIVDYYSITLKQGVGLSFGGARGTIAACFAAGGIGANIACANAPRGPVVAAQGGQLGGLTNPVILRTQNLSLITAKGIDIAIRYNFDLEDAIGIPGTIDIEALYTHVFSQGLMPTAASPLSNAAGLFNGGGATGLNAVPDDKVAARVTYRKGAYTVSLRWTMVGSMGDAFGRTFINIGAEHVLDITFGWDINDTVSVTLGVENVTNNKPPFTSAFAGTESNTDPSTFNAQLLGPRFFARAAANF